MLILFRDEEGLSFLLIGVVSGNLGTDTADCGSSQYPDYFSFIAHHNVSISCIVYIESLSENPQFYLLTDIELDFRDSYQSQK